MSFRHRCIHRGLNDIEIKYTTQITRLGLKTKYEVLKWKFWIVQARLPGGEATAIIQKIG